ncbi:MAG: hypothetical protein JNM74_24590 [Myxococcales bacterium]|nr:hypothetical protein [Myxococcales bacterium]
MSHSRPSLVRRTVLVLSVLAVACGSEAGSSSGAGSPSGSSVTAPTAAISNGTCALTLVDGATRTRWEGTARPSMNGSGNLRIVCLARSGDDRMEIAFGNGTFDGPRTYVSDEVSSDGSVTYETSDRGSYSSRTKGAGCTLVLSEAKLDGWGTSVPVGERIAGTFTCKGIVAQKSSATPRSYVVEGGEVAGLVER